MTERHKMGTGFLKMALYSIPPPDTHVVSEAARVIKNGNS